MVLTAELPPGVAQQATEAYVLLEKSAQHVTTCKEAVEATGTVAAASQPGSRADCVPSPITPTRPGKKSGWANP